MSDNPKVVRLDGAAVVLPGEPDPAVIGVLENLLERAKSGQLKWVIATGQTSDGHRMSAFAGPYRDNVYFGLGALAWLQHEFVHEATSGEKP